MIRRDNCAHIAAYYGQLMSHGFTSPLLTHYIDRYWFYVALSLDI